MQVGYVDISTNNSATQEVTKEQCYAKQILSLIP